MTTPLYELDAVSKQIGHRTILRDIGFTIEPGTFSMLLGNNGAGKTTLLRMLCGLMRPSSGILRFEGAPVARVAAELRRKVGVLSHESRLYGDLTAAENLHLFGELYGQSDLGRRIPDALARVRLDPVRDIPVRTFSSGMAKRVAIARLLLCEPSVLLLDEPYSGLDQDSVKLLDETLAAFHRDGGTAIMATHQFTPSTAECGRILILHQGHLVYNQAESQPSAQRCAELLNQFSAGRPAGSAQPSPPA
jgi:heme exporter protein A